MAKCFDSDDESSAPPPTAPAAPQQRPQQQQPAKSRASALYSDDDDDAPHAASPAGPPAAKVPQFKARTEWQPPASQFPPPAAQAPQPYQQQAYSSSAQPSQPQESSGYGSSTQQSQQGQVPPPQPQWTIPPPQLPQAPPQWSTQQQPQAPPPQEPLQQPQWSTQQPTAPSVPQQPYQQQGVQPAWATQSMPPQWSTQPQQPQTNWQPPSNQQQPPSQGPSSFSEPLAGSFSSTTASATQPEQPAPEPTPPPPPTRQQVQDANHPIPAPVPFTAPALPNTSRPQSVVLPQIPVQQQPRLDHVPQMAPAVAPTTGLSQHLQAATEGTVQASWEAFQQLRKQLDESHGRTVGLHQQVSQLQLTHEKEAASFRDAANAQIEQQRKALESTTEHYNELQLKVESMTALLSRKAEQIVKLEQNLHERTVSVSAMTQKVAHMDDRVKLSDSARQIAEVRCRELELTLEHSSQLVETLRKQLSGSYDDKVGAMQQQYQLFESNREQLVKYFAEREQQLVGNYNLALQNVQAIMEERMAEREVKVSSHWENIMAEVKLQYERLQRDANSAREDAHQQIKDFRDKMYTERDKAEAVHEKEIAVLEQRHREREDHILSDIARRERELGEREQKYRVQRATDEQDAKVALLSKEAEMKSYYEKMMEDLRSTHEKDRDRFISTFRDQIQQLSAQHLNNERELERMHREKEREMAQRYRVAGYEVDDRKGQVDLQDVTQKTQSALLSKFDNIENRQRERAEQSRAAFRTSTSLSSVGLPPGGAPAPAAASASLSAASPTSN